MGQAEKESPVCVRCVHVKTLQGTPVGFDKVCMMAPLPGKERTHKRGHEYCHKMNRGICVNFERTPTTK